MLRRKKQQKNSNLRSNSPPSNKSLSCKIVMSTIMEKLQRMIASLHAPEAPPAEEAPLAAEVPPTESILNEKVEEAITRRKSTGRPISIKEDSFTEDVMNVPLPLKFKEPIRDFDGTTDPIDHIQTFQDRVRLHGWPDAIACRAFSMTLRKDAREWFDTLSHGRSHRLQISQTNL
ncbi:Retrotrans gag domain-containing protein [Abeliophyllum distichum]|uniref:Retrotrans gag domain-containing protein n=1 Tax=Abeliophyllum distichum TaxID=126358 RepID=A0ABD1RXK8_9LAMI